MSTTSSTTIRQSGNRHLVLPTALMVVIFIFFIWNIFQVLQGAKYDTHYLESTGNLRVLAQQVATHSREAAEGKATAYDELEANRKSFSKEMTGLKKGSDTIPALSLMLKRDIDNLDKVWSRVDKASSAIFENKSRVLFLHEVASTLSASIPELQEKYNQVVDILVKNNAQAALIAEAQRQTLRAERIARNVDKMLLGGESTNAAADQFNKDAAMFGDVLNAMLKGDASMGIARIYNREARQTLGEIDALFQFITTSVDDIFEASPDLKKVHDAADNILVDAPVLTQQTSELVEKINNLESARSINSTTAMIAIGVIVILGAFIGYLLLLGTRNRLAETKATNDKNQEAILRLLDELADLADGDLTTTATVSEDFTGAIADSVNNTIDQLRILVSQINDTALKVSSAAEESQSTALHLADSSEHQAQEIAGASAAVNEMAVTIDQVSANAAESAQVADKSVRIANQGADVVQSTIHGMDTIREQIQDTSKRIKRLGESSQEIGDIVSLINDIADQTNILALNAAIQASMAGDAGRGFAVVADEVQRLAERSSAATKQIGALVKTIQSDTNEAVISMEQTTSEVVRGARLAQDGGTALEEIESVSQELADLIQNISNAARQQAASAGHISNTMNVIQEITQQTSAGTTTTARSIGNLAGMAQELKSSVAGFTLPEEAEHA